MDSFDFIPIPYNNERQTSLVACVVVVLSCLFFWVQEFNSSWTGLTKNRSLFNIKCDKGGSSIIQLKVDLNQASKSELTLLPQIGPKMANKILEYRNVNGNFAKIDDLINIKGIGEKTIEKIRPFCYVYNDSPQSAGTPSRH